jgi:hypothetical protein
MPLRLLRIKKILKEVFGLINKQDYDNKFMKGPEGGWLGTEQNSIYILQTLLNTSFLFITTAPFLIRISVSYCEKSSCQVNPT